MRDWGQTLESGEVERGLRDLNRDISFDPVIRRPSEFGYVLEMVPGARKAVERDRIPIIHNERSVSAMDRNTIPEFKVWTLVEKIVPTTLREVDHDDASMPYFVVPKSDPNYSDLFSETIRGLRDDYLVGSNGKLLKAWAHIPRKVRGPVFRLGWRHTFEQLLLAGIPGITRESLAGRFNVNMWKVPVGTPEETFAQIVEE